MNLTTENSSSIIQCVQWHRVSQAQHLIWHQILALAHRTEGYREYLGVALLCCYFAVYVHALSAIHVIIDVDNTLLLDGTSHIAQPSVTSWQPMLYRFYTAGLLAMGSFSAPTLV